ncbi:hypothetical protein BBK36DRAFT_1189792 [Trichoderma citrinoviride]|uniref:Uncharacterized protein n=1 Tax=Trichoderma citrinoviride TaxID=58853 RepID=A0A2T4AY87_9HYPO|nr:hypothetical protein BBK36DRAFT_1189792 [Trichoderma citrinoviride]PTB61948.1 hypothetical protein BBK36DRAFT_1189792 [Trichoderma citrinoviride]
MDDNIETFNLTPSETHDSSESHDISLEGNDDALPSTSTPDPTPSGPPSVGEHEAAFEDPGPSVDQDTHAASDSEAETWSGFSHPEAQYNIALQRLLEKARSRKQKVKKLEEEKRKHLEKEKRLEAELRQLKACKSRRTEVTWPSLFDGEGSRDWTAIYKLACMEGNASPLVSKIHPDLRLRGPTSEELQNDLLQKDAAPLRTMPEAFRVPADIQFRILKHFFHFKGKVVHAISRLDPNHAEDSAPLNRDGKPSFHHRLHVGRKPGRFAKGIRANVQRLQHVEILWIGSQYMAHELNERNKYTSRRTYSLIWLPEAIRLKTLGIYLPESSKDYMRRRHETNGMVRHMQRKSQLHPNFRGFRQLRTLQGLDYISCLRGLDRAEFWDFDRWLDTAQRKRPVRDWHFVQDVNNAVRRPKEAGDRCRSQLKNLFPLIPSFAPSEMDWAILLNGLESSDAQGPGPGTPEEVNMVGDSGSSSDSSSESDSDSGSDDGSDDGEDDAVQSSQTSSMIPRLRDLQLRNNDDSQVDAQSSAMEVEAHAGNDLEMGNGQEMDGDQDMVMDDGPQMVIDQHMDHDGVGDDEATIVPDNRSVAGEQVVDLTMDENGQQPEQEPVSQSTAPASGSRSESPLFVDDYRPSYSPSPTTTNSDDRDTAAEAENRSQTSGGQGDEESLFIGRAPTHLQQTPSVAGRPILWSPTASRDSRSVKREDKDPTDNFLPAENLNGTPSESRKRDMVKVEGGDGHVDGDGGSGSAKRPRISELRGSTCRVFHSFGF